MVGKWPEKGGKMVKTVARITAVAENDANDGDSDSSSDEGSDSEDSEQDEEGQGGDHLTPEQIAALRARQDTLTSQRTQQAKELAILQSKASLNPDEQTRLDELIDLCTETRKQEALRTLGPCPMGYDWRAETPHGYRCCGGSHYLTNDQLDKLCRQKYP